MEQYFKYWGKSTDDDSYHLSPYHCLDVAAVAAAWWDTSATIRRSFCRNEDEEQVRAWLLFFCSLHDYGKFDLRFQLKDKPTFRSLYGELDGTLPSEKDIKAYWHGEAGLYWLRKDIVALYGSPDCGGGLFFDEEVPEHWNAWKEWCEAVSGHHGHVKSSEYVSNAEFSSLVDEHYSQIDHTARVAWLYVLEKLFLKPANLSLTSQPPKASPLLAGFCSVADWLGSRCDNDNFSPLPTPKDLQVYFAEKLSADAQRVLKLAGIVGQAKPFSGVGALLPVDKNPRPLQLLTESLPSEPAVTIIEGPTGTGKTEAALARAWGLVDAGFADSIIFALPTQATANAMFGRLEKAATVLFADSPNLLLAHGYAKQNEAFASLKKRSRLEDGEEQDGWVKCSEWLAESRKRVFLGQIGVCTIDQVLISVLPVRHRFVRGFGVGRSVLIVDEVHAYDAYMYGLLEEVLRQQKASGGSAILLSATLPAGQKEKLFSAWGAELEADESPPYPLISSAAGKKVIPYPLPEGTPQEKVTVQLESMRVADMAPDADLISRLIAAAGKGAQVAVICNLVDVAQSLYERLMEGAKGLPIEVDLFHARFRFLDRQGKEAGVIGNFGPGGDRSKGRILVTTQVVEQSLDVDFDWLVTQLCPVDLLFQRMGRLHRHAENDATRPIEFNKRRCTVLLPTGKDYEGTGVVYANTRVLWRTEQLLLDTQEVSFPEAFRTWVDEVYRENGWRNEPAWVESGFAKFEEERWGKHYNARQMIHRAFEMNPFTDSDEQITAVTRDGEMSLTVIPYLVTGEGQQTIDGDLLDSLDEYRLQEILLLNSVGVPAGWKGYLEKIAEYTEGRYWLKIKPDDNGYLAEGEKVIFRYRRDTGLRRENK